MKMKVEIDIDDYLSEDEKKELCKEYVRVTLRGNENHKARVLSNMAYSAAFAILDSTLTPEMLETVRNKTVEQIGNITDFHIFRKKDVWGQEDSIAYLEVKKAVEENKHLIAPLVKKAMVEYDYLGELQNSSNYIAEVIIDAIAKGLDAIKQRD
jgi:hypothetical protein